MRSINLVFPSEIQGKQQVSSNPAIEKAKTPTFRKPVAKSTAATTQSKGLEDREFQTPMDYQGEQNPRMENSYVASRRKPHSCKPPAKKNKKTKQEK